MITPIILAIQSKGVAILVIISLLVVAAFIAYLTAWFYARSIYVKKIGILEEEKDELNDEIAGLKSENADLKESLGAKEDELAKLKSKSKPK